MDKLLVVPWSLKKRETIYIPLIRLGNSPRQFPPKEDRNEVITIDSNATPIATLVDDVVTSQCFHADLTCNS